MTMKNISSSNSLTCKFCGKKRTRQDFLVLVQLGRFISCA